jgi:TPR repeat protein
MTNQLFHDAVLSIEKKQYPIALDLLNRIILEDDLLKPHALHFMGWMYEQGLGVTRDLSKSFDFLVQASFLNVSESQIGLAVTI